MLILERHSGEAIHINDDIKLTIYYNKGSQIKMGIEAPRDVPIMREELLDINKKQYLEKQTQAQAQAHANGSETSIPASVVPLQSLKSEYKAKITTLLAPETKTPSVQIKTKRKKHMMPH